MRDFKYIDLISGRHEWEEVVSRFHAVRSKCLIPCAQAFRDSLTRTVDFSVFPAELAFLGWRDARFVANAIAQEAGANVLTPSAHIDTEMTDSMTESHERQLRDFNLLSDVEKNRIRYHVALSVDSAADQTIGMRASMDALLTSIVLESWLFFEAFCSDLWVSGVDNETPSMSARIRLNESWEKSDMRASSATKAVANAKTQPGSYYRELGMASFQKLRSIRHYFKIAFGDDIGKLFDTTANGYINALSALRNCIAHNAGRVDPTFKNNVSRFSEFNALNVGDRILLDGAIVRKLRVAAAETGLALLERADEILVAGV